MRRIHLLVLSPVFVMLAFSFTHERFLTSVNLLNAGRAAAVATVIGVGMMFLIASRSLDLSVGLLLVLIMAMAGTAMKGYGMPVPFAILIAIFGGALLGLIYGLEPRRRGF